MVTTPGGRGRSVALVGLSGAGKSVVGRGLAARLGWPLRDTDALVVAEVGRSVERVFAEQGEARFRDLEAAALGRALADGPCVVATGAGIVLREENRALLRRQALVAWLDAPSEALLARLLAHDEARPLLAVADPLSRLEQLRAARAALYAEVSDLQVTTAGRSVDELCEQLHRLVLERLP